MRSAGVSTRAKVGETKACHTSIEMFSYDGTTEYGGRGGGAGNSLKFINVSGPLPSFAFFLSLSSSLCRL